DDPQLADDLMRYFPAVLQEKYAEGTARHRLRREIIATVVTNSLVNRVGPTFVHVMKEKTGLPASEIARAYAICRGAFHLRRRGPWPGSAGLATEVPAPQQYAMLQATIRLAETGTLWLLRNLAPPLDIAANIAAFRPGIAALTAEIQGLVPDGSFGAMAEHAE